jgi:hypothetical protein
MSAILDIELLELIFSHLEWKPHLHAASLVCHAYHAAAIHFIWKELKSLVPLLKLLPADAYSENRSDGSVVSKTCSLICAYY